MSFAAEYLLICCAIGVLFFVVVFAVEWMSRKVDTTGSDTGAPEGDDRHFRKR